VCICGRGGWRGFCFAFERGCFGRDFPKWGSSMTDRKRSVKLLKKDSSGAREVRQEIGEEIKPSATQPRQKNPNRDRARGDWDRTGIHHDEGMSRADEE
jgi:hypothetical protein